MDAIFEALLFLSIGLIAVTVTVFVLAVSLLGRAIKISIQEQKEAEEKGKKETEEEIKRIQDKLEESRTKGSVDVEKLRDDLKELEKRQKKHKQKLNWIKTKPSLLRVDGGVLLPGVFFIFAILFIILARFELSQNPDASVYGYCIGAVLSICSGIYIIYQILKVIEGVAVTSEETSLVRQKDMFKSALVEIEDEKKTELTLEFVDSQPPFSVVTESEIVIKFRIGLSKGYLAKHPIIAFWAPSCFTFPDRTMELPTRYEKYESYTSCRLETTDILTPFERLMSVKIKTPVQPGSYTLAYRLFCEGFYSDHQEFEVIVEEPEDLPF